MTEPLGALVGARVRRVDVPDPDLLALGLGGRELRVVLLLCTDPAHPDLGCVAERPRGRPAEGVAKQLRNLVEGARIERVLDVGGGAVAIDLRRGPESIALVHESLGDRSNVLVLDAAGHIVAALHPSRLTARASAIGAPWAPLELELPPRDLPEGLDELLARGAALLDARRDDVGRARRRALDRALRRAQRRMERRAEATLADLDRAAEVPLLRDRGSAILASLSTIPRNATEIELPDWSRDPPGTLTLTIDPKLGARGTADALFTRARKLEKGVEIASVRHDDALRSAETIASLLRELAVGDDDQLASIEERAQALGVAPEAAPRARRREPEVHSAFRRYVGAGGRAILVGKGSTDNDTLTFEHASPHDLWLHVRGVTGSHVIVPLARGEVCPPELLVDAAHLAAHFSSARGELRVEVQYTPRKYLRKPKGGAPGTVLVSTERSFLVRIEPERLERLLAPAR